jgi:hypothetical protein
MPAGSATVCGRPGQLGGLLGFITLLAAFGSEEQKQHKKEKPMVLVIRIWRY